MNLYSCFLKNEEWGCFVVAPSRGRAKTLFYNYAKIELGQYVEFTDVRCYKLKIVDQQEEKVYDMDCPELEAMGVHFANEDEWEDE